jgi:hypothetical protein
LAHDADDTPPADDREEGPAPDVLAAIHRTRDGLLAAEEKKKADGTWTLEDMLKVADALGKLERAEQYHTARLADEEVLRRLTGGQDGYRLPENTSASKQSSYRLTDEGVVHSYTKGTGKATVLEEEVIAFRPFVPVERLKDDQGRHQYRIAWLDTAGEVQELVMTAEETASRTLFTRAFPDHVVTSVHVMACVEYMSQCLRYNQQWLQDRVKVAATQLGWSAQLADGEMDVEQFTSGPGRPRHVQDVKNTGAWLEGHCSRGRIEEWKEAVADCADRPVILAALSAAFAAPLLRVVGAANVVVDVSGTTSVGKTVLLGLCTSVWADPGRSMLSWENTRVAMEHYMSMLRGMPLFVDETQLADPKILEELVYGITQGKSRGRSTQDGTGMIDGQQWETVLVTTGEQPITSMTTKGGLSPRIVPLTGAPCRDRAHAERVRRVSRRSYGRAGEVFLQEVARLGDEALQVRYEELKEALAGQVQSSVAQRRAESVAVLALANEVAAGAGLMPLAPPQVWVWAASGADSSVEGDEDDRPRGALRAVMSWAQVNGHRFYGHEDAMSVPPASGWAGRWDTDEFVAFHPETLRKLLADLGYEHGNILPAWRERGWLQHKPDKYTFTVRVGGKPGLFIKIIHMEDVVDPGSAEGGEEAADPRMAWVRSLTR